MSSHRTWFATWAALAACALLVAGGCKTAPDVDESVEPTGPFAELQKLVPKSDELVGWHRSGRMQILVGGAYRAPVAGEPVDLSQYATFSQGEFADEAPLFAEYQHRATVTQVFEEDDDAGGKLSLEIHQMPNAD